MKFKIIEMYFADLIDMCLHFHYLLELDGRLLATTGQKYERMNPDEACTTLAQLLLDKPFNTNLEHYCILSKNPGAGWNVLLEQEVSDHYLKDIKIQQRIKDIERDFKDE